MRDACAQAGVEPRELGFVAAGANGTPNIDKVEAEALRAVGAAPVTAYKVKTGECYGSSTVLGVACALADLQRERVCGVGDEYVKLDGLDIVTEPMRTVKAKTAAVNAVSCDGNCGTIILRRA
jgi:act minimal PKS chain-length factor (CLF/KS beta)